MRATPAFQDPFFRERCQRHQGKNLSHFVEILRDNTEEFLTFRFAEEGAEVLLFRRAEVNKATEGILEDAGIALSRRGSMDMLAVWNAKRPEKGK